MKTRQVVSAVILWLAVLAPSPSLAARFFASAGPTGTSDFGFRGGWGVSLGLAQPLAGPAALLVRGDASALPSSHSVVQPQHIMMGAAFGEPGPNGMTSTATLSSLMLGLRLQSPGAIHSYLDALVGFSHLNDPNRAAGPISEDTNMGISIGTGFELPHTPLGSAFADVRYDFHAVRGATTPVIPVRLGLLVP